MKILDIIQKRRSVRTFDESALKPDDLQKIMEYAGSVKTPYDIPITWKALSAKEHGLTTPVIVGTDTFIAGKMHRVPHAEEAFGYAFEQVVLFAEELGVGTTWIAGTMDRAAFEKAMAISEGEVMPCVSPLGYPAKKLSMREALMRKGVKADSRFAFDELFFKNSFEQPLKKENAGKLADVFEAVRLSPSAVNKQPWRAVLCGNKVHFYEQRSRGYLQDDWDIQKIDMGIALCHFALAAKEAGISLTWSIDEPQINLPDKTEYIASYEIKE